MTIVHTKSLEDHKPIILNAYKQPVGPDERTLTKFSNFLGTLDRNSIKVPLNFKSWHNVPRDNKNSLWEFVQKKYSVPEEGRKWVLQTIGACWRAYKGRLKRDHFTKYKTDELRLKHCPKNVPMEQFRGLLKYWSSKETLDMTQ